MFCRRAKGKARSTKYEVRNSAVFIFVSLLLFSLNFFAQSSCSCDEEKLKFGKAYVDAHQLILRGKTLSIEKGADYGMAHFTVTQLFKGSCPKEITVYFDKKSACTLKIAAGEDWLIYADFKQIQKPFVEYCSRSRKNVVNSNKNVEVQYIKSDLTIDQECEQLQEQLGTQRFAPQAEEDNRHSNIIPNFWQRIVLVLISIAGFVLIYFLLNRFLKNQKG